MGQRTKIDWCDSSWNPVTGCEHRCPYCYAKGIAERFGTNWLPDENPDDYKCVLDGTETHAILELDGMQARKQKDGKIVPAAFPLGFTPTLHRYRLDEPQKWTKPRVIFVCSMADLFGEWVPDEWIEAVFEACKAAPQHRYLFLTKNGKRYVDLYAKAILPVGEGFWYGTTTTAPEQPFFFSRMPDDNPHTFASIEPIMEPFGEIKAFPEWVIIGAETGNRKGKVIPPKEWVDEIVQQAQQRMVPVFMKESLRAIMGADVRQEFPWHTGDGRNGDYCEL